MIQAPHPPTDTLFDPPGVIDSATDDLPSLLASSAVRLGPYETSPIADLSQRLYHLKDHKERSAAFAALAALSAAGTLRSATKPHVNHNRLDRFFHCASSTSIVSHPLRSEYRLVGNFCRDRWCPSCARTRRRRTVHDLAPALAQAVAARPVAVPRLVTLTLRHKDEPLNVLLTHLRSCWKALSADPWWQQVAPGGIWALEIKTARRGGWHPHLHAIVLSPWISARTLRTKWRAITGGSDNIDVLQVAADPQGRYSKALSYIAKYISKPANLASWSLPSRQEIIIAARSVRLWSTWGTLKAAKALVTAAQIDKSADEPWVHVAPLTLVLARAIAGHHESRVLLATLRLNDWHVFSPAPVAPPFYYVVPPVPPD